MADDDINDLQRIKQLTSSIRFESEHVRNQVEQMLAKYSDVSDILKKNRDLTRSEAEFAKDYLATVSRMTSPLVEHTRHLNESSRALLAMERSAERYRVAAEKAGAVSARLSERLKGVRKERASYEERFSQAESGYKAASGLHAKFRAGKATTNDMLNAGLGGMSEQDQAAALRTRVAAAWKEVEAANKKASAVDRQIQSILTQKKLADDLSKRDRERMTAAETIYVANAKLLPVLQKQKDLEAKRGQQASKTIQQAEHYDRRRRGTTFASDMAINVASDMNIPGVSMLAQVERYRRLMSNNSGVFSRMGNGVAGMAMGGIRAAGRGALGLGGMLAGHGDELQERGGFAGRVGGWMGGAGRALGGAGGAMRNAEDDGSLGGVASFLARGAAVPLALGAMVGGVGVQKFRQAMGDAESMTGPQRTLMGQVGGGRMGLANAGYRQDLTDLGMDTRQAQANMIGLNRAIGGRSGPLRMRETGSLAQAFGMDFGETAGQAGSLMRAGGSAPTTAVHNLQKIMMEGVKAGMDRARITEFTSQVISIQEQLLREGGHNNAQNIARSLATFMGASGKQGQEFFQGAGFQGLMGLDRGMKGFARGGSGPGAGTMYRAFSGGAGGGSPSSRYVNLMEKMEGGLFGGEGGDSAASRAKTILGQYFADSGAKDLFEKKVAGKSKGFSGADRERYQSAEDVVRVRMQQELGVGYGQSKELLRLMENVNQKMTSPEGQKELKRVMEDMRDKTHDPLVVLGDRMARANSSLTDIALSSRSMAAFLKVKDIEIKVNETMKPIVEVGADIFVRGATAFEDAVGGFATNVTTMARIFGSDEMTPEQRKSLDADLQGATGKSLDQLDQGGMSMFSFLMEGMRRLFGGATPPTGKGLGDPNAPKSAAGVPLTPEALRLISSLVSDGKSSAEIVAAINVLSGHVQENTSVTQQGNGIMLKSGKSGNAGGAGRGH